jgi:hypothetical protein
MCALPTQVAQTQAYRNQTKGSTGGCAHGTVLTTAVACMWQHMAAHTVCALCTQCDATMFQLQRMKVHAYQQPATGGGRERSRTMHAEPTLSRNKGGRHHYKEQCPHQGGTHPNLQPTEQQKLQLYQQKQRHICTCADTATCNGFGPSKTGRERKQP